MPVDAAPISLWIRHRISPDNVDAYRAATLANALHTNQEPGCLRFDVLVDPEDPCSFVLYEAYRDKEAQQAHLSSEHFQIWKAAARPLIAEASISRWSPVHVPA